MCMRISATDLHAHTHMYIHIHAHSQLLCSAQKYIFAYSHTLHNKCKFVRVGECACIVHEDAMLDVGGIDDVEWRHHIALALCLHYTQCASMRTRMHMRTSMWIFMRTCVCICAKRSIQRMRNYRRVRDKADVLTHVCCVNNMYVMVTMKAKQHTASHCNTLQVVALCCWVLNTLQHSVSHCNTLQNTARYMHNMYVLFTINARQMYALIEWILSV